MPYHRTYPITEHSLSQSMPYHITCSITELSTQQSLPLPLNLSYHRSCLITETLYHRAHSIAYPSLSQNPLFYPSCSIAEPVALHTISQNKIGNDLGSTGKARLMRIWERDQPVIGRTCCLLPPPLKDSLNVKRSGHLLSTRYNCTKHTTTGTHQHPVSANFITLPRHCFIQNLQTSRQMNSSMTTLRVQVQKKHTKKSTLVVFCKIEFLVLFS